jgi:hypothetical protein
LEQLFEVLPRIKDIRIRHSLTSECISVLLKQENLESITYSTDAQSLVRKSEPLVIKCTKLTRFNVLETMNEVPLDLQTKLTLLKMNPALKKDFHFMKFAARELLNFADMESNSADAFSILDLILALNDYRVYETFWSHFDNNVLVILNSNIDYAYRLISKTMQQVLAMPEARRLTDSSLHNLCNTLIDVSPLLTQDFPDFLQQFDPADYAAITALGALYDEHKLRMEQLQLSFEKFKKRPFHRQAREHYINCHFVFLEQIRGSPKFEQELNDVISTISPIMKRMPRRIRLLRASLCARQGKFQEACDEYIGIIDPRYVLKINADLSEDKNAQAIFGAYHLAKDYLASPELLLKIETLNPENYKTIVKHFENIQSCYDRGLCTKGTTRPEFLKQYWYACYTCDMPGDFAGLCFSCAKHCHTDHEIAYLRASDCYCDCRDHPKGSPI